MPFPFLFDRQRRSDSGGPEGPAPHQAAAQKSANIFINPGWGGGDGGVGTKKTFAASKSIGAPSSKIHTTPLLADKSLEFKDRT